MNVAVFGGSFNPPHISHVMACTLALTVEDAERVLVVPAYRHPFGKPLASFGDRVRMCELAMAWIPGVEVSRIEEELGGESRTLRTLEHLAGAHPDWKLRLLLGADILADAPRWFGFDAIAMLAPPIVFARAGTGATAPSGPLLPEVSSTRIRFAIARGEWTEVEKLVPRKVLAYVRSKGLYGTPA